MQRSLLSFTLPELRTFLSENSFAKFGADQIYDWVYKKFNFDVASWSNVSKKFKSYFVEHMNLALPEIINVQRSTDSTVKFLMQFSDNKCVETVIIPSKDRLTLCISTQVGCAIGCRFCNTAQMGFIRHLSVEEIIGQYMRATTWLRSEIDPEGVIGNVVFMGQGEPLHNYENTKSVVEILMEPKGLGIGQRKITVSTSGLAPQIKKLKDFPPVNIAISLHAAFDEIRDQLMPINKVHNIKSLFDALKEIPLKAHRSITYEYLLIKDLNDRKEDVEGLCRLLDKKTAKINIIPFNEFEGSVFHRPSEEKITWFKEALLKKGYVCTVRISKGDDILAACGQLHTKILG